MTSSRRNRSGTYGRINSVLQGIGIALVAQALGLSFGHQLLFIAGAVLAMTPLYPLRVLAQLTHRDAPEEGRTP